MNSKTFMGDRESLQALVDLLPQDVRAEYVAYQCLGLESAFPGRKLVVYALDGDRPTDFEILTFAHLRMKSDNELEVEVLSDRSRYPFIVGMVPIQVPGREIFLHLPQTFEFKWKGKTGGGGVEFAAHYAVLIKSRSKPHRREPGHTYCVKFNDFQEQFPSVKLRY